MTDALVDTETAESLLDKVRDIEPVIRGHAEEAEHNRRLSQAVVDAMRDAGLFRVWTPRALGGFELDPMSAYRIYEAVARIDSAAGWCLANSASMPAIGPWLPDEGAAEVFGEPQTITAGTLFPPAEAVPVDGGYRVTGRMPFVSLCQSATWFLAPAQILDGDTVRTDAAGIPEPLVVVYPARDAEIIDTWNTLGMRGTGSHDVAVLDVFVPEHRTTMLRPWEEPGSAVTGPLYRCGVMINAPVVAVVNLASAAAALEAALGLALKKTPAYMANPLRDRSVAQSQLAEARATIEERGGP